MAFRFFKSFSLGKLLRLNFSKRGVGVSVGPRGLSMSIGPRGTYLNASFGMGLSARTRLDTPAPKAAPAARSLPETLHPAFGAKYIGRRFKGDLGEGKDEIIKITDVTVDQGVPHLHVEFNDSGRVYAYTMESFGAKFSHMQEIDQNGQICP